MVQVHSPRSLLMGHQLRREHFYLLERVDKIEASLNKDQGTAQETNEVITSIIRDVFASEYANHSAEVRDLFDSIRTEIDEQKKSMVSITLAIHKHLEELEQHQAVSVKVHERSDAKADASAVADCNRTVQTVMTLVQQTAQEMPAIFDRLNRLESRIACCLGSIEAGKREHEVSTHIPPRETLPNPPVDTTRQDGPEVNSFLIDTEKVVREVDKMLSSDSSTLTTVSAYPSSPPLAAATGPYVPTSPISIAKLLEEMESERHPGEEQLHRNKAYLPQNRQNETIATQPLVSDIQRVTRRSLIDTLQTDTLLTALDDPDQMLRKGKSKIRPLDGNHKEPPNSTLTALQAQTVQASDRLAANDTAQASASHGEVIPSKEHPLIARMKARSRIASVSLR